ncbi:MAG: class I SAM-dependent methyltransferase [Acidobacteria bacterium]|nr:class I SAM-dependent methyltransferase [Acidobacteriota bacterium]
MHPTPARPQGTASSADVAAYWNARIHDLEMTTHPVGTRAFFDDLDAYRFDKLHYLPRLVDFQGFAGQSVLEIGCGIGTDLVRFARGGARVTGVDLSQTAIDLACTNMSLNGLTADLRVADGAALPFDRATFDVVYAHGVLQYAAEPARLVAEARRVLRPDGLAIFMVYNQVSWLQAMSRVMKVGLEHGDAPVLTLYSIAQFKALLAPFRDVRIEPERFPVASRLHKGWKGTLYNRLFVGTFNALPRAWVKRYGWHLMAFCRP